jgi:hypothetical protein
MGDKQYLGKFAKDLPREVLEELLKKGYSVSPESGRIRKRIKKKKKKDGFTKRKLNKAVQKIGWIALAILFLFSLLLLFPHMGDKKKSNFEKIR